MSCTTKTNAHQLLVGVEDLLIFLPLHLLPSCFSKLFIPCGHLELFCLVVVKIIQDTKEKTVYACACVVFKERDASGLFIVLKMLGASGGKLRIILHGV